MNLILTLQIQTIQIKFVRVIWLKIADPIQLINTIPIRKLFKRERNVIGLNPGKINLIEL